MRPRSGSVTINGITDADLIKILQVKERYEGSLLFNPQQMQVGLEQPRPGQPPSPQPQRSTGYNNVILLWNEEKGLNAVLEILQHLSQQTQQFQQ